ncbi:ankyrin repeat-containing domain protein [Xylaria telfairii]|nr:ankyrin repeat-containing domain protein [Xylaria telfairii]
MSDIASATTQELTALRAVIREHWLRNDLSQKTVIKILRQFYGVQVSDAQFRNIVIRVWRYCKNLSIGDWKYFHQQKMKRGGKPSVAIVAGIRVRDSKKSERRVKHTNADSFGPKASNQLTRPPASEWLSVGSPPPHEADIILFDATKLPTVSFLQTLNTSISGVTLSPSNRTWVMGLAAFGLAHGLHVELGLLAGRLASRQDCYRQVLLPLAFWEECSILPLASPKDALRNRLELLVYFLVNKMTPSSWSRSKDQQLIELVSRTSFLGLWKASPTSDSHTATMSILENIFGSAVRLGNVDLVRELLEAGMNINQPVDPIYHLARLERINSDLDGASSMTPLQLAVCLGYTELVRFLLDQGADIRSSVHDISILQLAIMSGRSGDAIDSEILYLVLSVAESFTGYDYLKAWKTADKSHNKPALGYIFHFLQRFEYDPTDNTKFLTSAILHGLPEIADHILTNNKVYLNSESVGRVSPLTATAISGDVNLCRRLLGMGASATFAEDFIKEGRQGDPFPTTLQMAAFAGNIAIVELLLQAGSPINFNFPSGRTPKIDLSRNHEAMPRTALQAALLRGDQQMAMLLLKFGAKWIGGEYATAVLQKFDAVRDHLEQQGMTIHDRIPGGQTVLEAAILISDNDLAFSIMENHPDSITSAVLVSVVHMAVRVMSLRASEGGAIDALFLPRRFFEYANGRFCMNDDLSGFALAIAALNGKSELVHFLLDKGLRPVRCPSRTHIVDHIHEDHYSTQSWKEKACCWMHNHFWSEGGVGHLLINDNQSIVGMFTRDADLESFNYLFDNGYAPDSSCMVAALDNEYQPLVRMERLLREGATVNDYDVDGYTPLQLAIFGGQDEIVRWLLSKDADVNLPPAFVFGRTALQAAAERGNSEILDVLLNKKADVNAPPGTIGGGTALQLAAAQGYIGIVETLIKWGADVDAAAGAPINRTALEGAAEHNRIDMVEFLLACGTKTTGAWQNQYIRAIVFAEKGGHEACARLLKKHRRWTVLDYDIYRSRGGHDGESIIGAPRQNLKGPGDVP